jgi:two-component system KDP operon response regulator KdpE
MRRKPGACNLLWNQCRADTDTTTKKVKKTTVLIIDDEKAIRRAVRNALATDDTRVIEASTAREGIDLAATEQPDLIILDLGLPDGGGLDVCREVRSWGATPILVLSARHDEQDKVALLDAGADDYVTKPFSTAELLARVRALLRRAVTASTGAVQTVIKGRELEIDLVARTVRVKRTVVHLTPIEWEILRTLATNAGRTLTHRQIHSAVWNARTIGDVQQHLRVHIAHLRRKLEPDLLQPTYIITEPGVGYRLSLE